MWPSCVLLWVVPCVVLSSARVWAQGPPAPTAGAAPPAFVEGVDVQVVTHPDSLTVGDRATLEVIVAAPPGVEVHFPPGNAIASQKIGVHSLEVQAPESEVQVPESTGDETAATDDPSATPQEASASQRATWIARYAIGVYAVGEVVLPPWPVQVRKDSAAAIVHSDSVRLFVESVLDDSLAAADIRDLKPQHEVPVPWGWWVWATLIALLALVVLGLWRRRRRRPAALAPLPPPRPAHEVALAELRKLETAQLPAEGKIKQHYMALSEILRTYLEHAQQFRVPALEETTHEIVEELRSRGFKPSIIEELTALCEEADLVKFAKHKPPLDRCTEALEETRRFVIDTSKMVQLLDMPLPADPVGAAVPLDAAPASVAPGAAPNNGGGGDGDGDASSGKSSGEAQS